MKKLLLFLLIFISTHLFAQKINITGIVADGDGKAMENATVLLLAASDSSLVSFGRTKPTGTFELKNVSLSANCFLKLTFVGYEPYFQDIAKDTKPTNGNTLELSGIRMTPLSKLLNEAVIKAERDPVKINGDTTEFNASSFKVQPNATSEDLIKKLPGMEVDKNGNVKAQGEAVTQVLVNGKKFFGKDPKIALQNLPAGAVDKVKVYDKRSDQAEFSGIDDGEREKTIDIQLKKDYSQGTFGNGTLGGGGVEGDVASRYLGKFAINNFSKTQQLSFLGNGNNINQTGFSMEDYAGFTGATRQMASGGGMRISSDNTNGVPLDMGGTKGFLKTWSGGVNYNKVFSKKTELNMSYFFNDQTSDNRTTTNRVNNLSSRGAKFTNTVSDALTTNQNHRLNLTFDHKIDTFTSLKLTSNVSKTKNSSANYTTTENLLSDKKTLQNSGINANNTEGGGMSAQNSLLLRRRFMKKGRTVSANIFFNYNESTSDGNLNSSQIFYNDGIGKPNPDIVQDDNRVNERSNYGTTLSFTEPLGKRQYLEANYSYTATVNNADRDVHKLVNNERIADTVLSNKYINDYIYQRTGLTYRINKKEWNFSTGLQYQHSDLNGDLITKKTTIKNSYDFALPNMRFEYSPVQGKRATFSYETSVREPSITQLQPITDNSNPLYISRGNPDLIPEYNNRIRVGYNHFNQATFSAFFSNISFNYTNNKITNVQTSDTSGRRLSQPINVRNDISSNGFIGYNVPLVPQLLRFNMRSNASYGRGLGFINTADNLNSRTPNITSIENLINRASIGLTLGLTLTVKDSFDLSVSGTVNHNTTGYSAQPQNNQKYNIYDLETDFNWRLPLGLKLNSSFTYNIIKGGSFGTSQGIPLLNAGISKYMLKQNRGELKFQVVDILNKNKGYSRSENVNYTQEEYVTSLGRYALLSFTYAFNPMGGMFGGGRGGRGGGMRMIMREN
jgi:outer membrane receptor protein involved in Fe transport